MADLDVTRAGGASGAMSRAAQLQAQAAANAAQRAAMMIRRQQQAPPTTPPSGLNPATGLPQMHMPEPARLPVMDLLNPNGTPQSEPIGLGAVGANLIAPGHKSDDARDIRNGKDKFNQAPAPPIIDPAEADRQKHFADYRENAPSASGVQAQRGSSVYDSTIKQMLEDVQHDPTATPDRIAAAQELSDQFQEGSKYRFYTKNDLLENPYLKTLNELSVWSTYRRKVSDWMSAKKKTGATDQPQDAGDGTLNSTLENGSFSSVTSPSALAPYLVTRDEHGMLQVVTADQWIQGKYTEMHNDPRFAAQMITALALASEYGTDSTANSQASRVALDRNGNPVKGLTSSEDLAALKRFANDAAIFQGQGDEVAVDDVLSQIVGLGSQVSAQNGANGEHGGGGGFGHGGGGGGANAVRYTDSAELNAQLDSVARAQMGRGATPEERAAFVDYFHQLEAANDAAAFAGQAYSTVNPQAQAMAWVEQHNKRESNTNQYGNLAAQFITMMGSSNPFASIGASQ